MTTVSPQALLLLNDDFMEKQSAALARRLKSEAGDDTRAQIAHAYRLAFGRRPDESEALTAVEFINRQRVRLEQTGARLLFRPDISPSLESGYMGRMRAEEFLRGPQHGWSYHRGRWSAVYEGIRTLERFQAPFALWTNVVSEDLDVEGTLVVPPASEYFGLIVRGTADGDTLKGYELLFDLRHDSLRLIRHGKMITALADATAPMLMGKSTPFRIVIRGGHVTAWLDNTPVLDLDDAEPITGSGHFGLRPWGGALALDGLQSRSEGVTATIPKPSTQQLDHRALQAWCLLLLNLNEVIYVD